MNYGRCFFNPAHFQGNGQISKGYDEILNGKKAVTWAIILQRFQVDKKLLKEAARSRESFNALYKKHKVIPD
jgi:hypothetical protein